VYTMLAMVPEMFAFNYMLKANSSQIRGKVGVCTKLYGLSSVVCGFRSRKPKPGKPRR
jgi:hypothetical protein